MPCPAILPGKGALLPFPRFAPASRSIHSSSKDDTGRKSERAFRLTRAAQDSKVELNHVPVAPISLTSGALQHLEKLGNDKGQIPIILRVGVKSGGCSGMSYVMDFVEPEEEVVKGDTVLNLEDGKIEIRIDPKSLLYLFGLQLDYSDALIGGGFKFFNPNAESTCGCGTSFNV